VTYFQLSQLEKQRCQIVDGDFPSIAAAKQLIAEQIRTRTAYMYDDQLSQHSPVYVIAAYLSPALVPYLTSEEVALAEKPLKLRIDLGISRLF
jgi:hypothetical protein